MTFASFWNKYKLYKLRDMMKRKIHKVEGGAHIFRPYQSKVIAGLRGMAVGPSVAPNQCNWM